MGAFEAVSLSTARKCDPSPAPGPPALDTDLLNWTTLVGGGSGVGVATFAGYDATDRFLIFHSADAPLLPALSTLALRESDIGCRIVIAYESGDTHRPVIVGRLQARPAAESSTVRLDGDRLLLQAEREIELRCGDASIVLTRAGKVLIKGAYVLSRSKGANRVKGAYVDIN